MAERALLQEAAAPEAVAESVDQFFVLFSGYLV